MWTARRFGRDFRVAVRTILRFRCGCILIGDAEFLAEPSHLLDDDEDGEGDDEEVDDGLEECTVTDNRFTECDTECGDIDTLEDNANEGCDDIGDEGGDDLAKGATDDDTDCEIDDIATECEFFEILEHGV